MKLARHSDALVHGICILGLLIGSCFAQTRAQCSFSVFSAPAGYYLASVNGISADGVVVGMLEQKRTLQDVAFSRDTSGRFTTYAAPRSYSTWFSKRNKGGVIVGSYQDRSYNSHVHGFVLQVSKFARVDFPHSNDSWLNAINDSGVMAGAYGANSGTRGFTLQNGKYFQFQYPGALDTTPYGISDTGTIVGEYDFDGMFMHGFILRNGKFTTVDHPAGSLGTILTDVNGAGVIVGNYDSGDDYLYGFLYKNGGFSNVSYNGNRTVVGAINNAGVIAGTVYLSSGIRGYTATCK